MYHGLCVRSVIAEWNHHGALAYRENSNTTSPLSHIVRGLLTRRRGGWALLLQIGPTTIPDIYICGKKATVEAVPTGRITNLRSALLAAEGDVDHRSIIRRLYDYFLHVPEHYGYYSMQLSQGLFCDDHRRILTRELSEFRTSIQLERHLTTDQPLDIHLNRTYFGPDVYGIESAAEHYIGKPASQLSVAEAALLVGLIKSPTRFSPLAHPRQSSGAAK